MLGYNVIDVSSYIIEYSNKINSPVSNLKLQKLLRHHQQVWVDINQIV